MITRRGFLEAVGVGACLAPIPVQGSQRLPPSMTTGYGVPEASKQIYVGTDRQYLCDDFLLTTGSELEKDFPHNVRFNVGRAYKDERPVMLPGIDAPWEKEGMYWVTVIYDGGRYRCWYNVSSYQPASSSYPQQRSIGNNQVVWMIVSYAESDDGVSWRKPILNLIELNGSKANNICFLGDLTRWTEGCGVFIDPSAKPEERYKMIFGGSSGLKGAYSSDGLQWKLKSGVFEVRGLDT